MRRYIAFLRGINVGGHHLIKMPWLVNLFSAIGLVDVKSYIASGNILFSSENEDMDALTAKIEEALLLSLEYPVTVMIRSQEELQTLVASKPFRGHTTRENVKLYVTFLPKMTVPTLALPIVSVTEGYEIIAASDREICSVSSLMPDGRYGSSVHFIEQQITKNSTTRNWNTVLKVAKF